MLQALFFWESNKEGLCPQSGLSDAEKDNIFDELHLVVMTTPTS